MAENRGFPGHRHCRIDHGTAECLTKNDVQTIAYGLSPPADSAIASLSCLTRLYRTTTFPILLPLPPACHPPRSEDRRLGKRVSVRGDIGCGRLIAKNTNNNEKISH